MIEKRHIEDYNENDIVVVRRRITPTKEMVEELEKAMKTYQEALDVKRTREKRIHDLQQIVHAGGVKGLTAKNEIEQLQKQDLLEMNKREITSTSRKKIVQKKIETYVTEQNKLEDERVKVETKRLQEEKKEEIERLKREEEERVQRELERIKNEKEEKIKQEEERVRLEKEKKEKEEEERRRKNKERLKQKASLWK